MSSTRPILVTDLHGRVTQGVYAKGSKSEYDAIFLQNANARYILRQKSGLAFNDSALRQYLGHEVKSDGFLVGTTLLAERIEVVG